MSACNSDHADARYALENSSDYARETEYSSNMSSNSNGSGSGNGIDSRVNCSGNGSMIQGEYDGHNGTVFLMKLITTIIIINRKR